MSVFGVQIHFHIGHIRPVCSLFENASVLKNLTHFSKFKNQISN